MRRIRKTLEGDLAPRALLMGGAAILTIVVLSDLAGARDRAPELRETMRAVQAEQAGAASVPSVYSVPRDLASEAMLAARAQQMPEAIVIAEAEMAEEIVEDVAVPEDAVEDSAEAELADEAIEDVAEAVLSEEVLGAVSEPELTGEVVEELAEAAAAEETAVDLAASEEVTEASTVDMDAGSAELGDLSLLASANVDNGQRVWRQCGACHVYDAEQNRGGPHLVNIVGREIGSAEGWRYSRALSEHGGVWTVEGLLAWLENPDTYIPGNQMAFRGLRNEQDRIDILGFLNANRSD